MILRFFFFLSLLFFVACDTDKTADKNASKALSWGQGDKISFNLDLGNAELLNIRSSSDKLEFVSNDKAILFVFFTTWCEPCLAELPHLNKLQEKYKDNFNIIGVLLEDISKEELAQFVSKHNINFKIAQGENNFLFAQSVGGIHGIPTMLLYSSSGIFSNKYLGIIPQEMLDIDIQKAIM